MIGAGGTEAQRLRDAARGVGQSHVASAKSICPICRLLAAIDIVLGDA